MPTRPVSTVVIRASNLNYAGGPVALQGTATKIMPPAASTDDGWQADQKPPAQWQNFNDHTPDEWVKWLSLGTDAKQEEAHVLEADILGRTSLVALDVGNIVGSDLESIVCRPNGGSNITGLFVETSFNKPGAHFLGIFEAVSAAQFLYTAGNVADSASPGLLRFDVEQDGPPAIRIEAATQQAAVFINQTRFTGPCIKAQAGPGDDGELAGGPAFWGVAGTDDSFTPGGLAGRFDSTQPLGDCVNINMTGGAATGAALRIVSTNASTAIIASQVSGKGTAVHLFSSNQGSDRNAPLRLQPQNFDVSGLGALDGVYWHRTNTFTNGSGGGEQHHPRFYGQQAMWLQWTSQPMCAIDEHIQTSDPHIEGQDNNAFFVVQTVEFPDKMIPLAVGIVIIHVRGMIRRNAQATDILDKDGCSIKLVDLGPSGGDIIETEFDLVAKDVGQIANTIYTWYEMTIEYALPTSGPREFQVLAARNPSGASGAITVRDPSISVRPLPSGQD